MVVQASSESGVLGVGVTVRINPGDARFYGRVGRTRRIGDLTLTETLFEPSSVVPLHSHDSSRLCFVLEGGFTERVGDTAKRCGPGSLLFHPRDEPHAQQFDRTVSRCLTIQLGRCFASRISEFGVRAPMRPITVRRRAAWLAMSLYEEFCRLDTASDLATEGLCLTMLAELTRDDAARADNAHCPRWLQVVRHLLEQRYAEPVRLDKLAATVDVHPTHFSRVFHQRLGVTLTGYVRERRLELAVEKLLGTSLPTSQIAVETGFCDHPHFTRAFKEATGMTPRAFREAVTARGASRNAG